MKLYLVHSLICYVKHTDTKHTQELNESFLQLVPTTSIYVTEISVVFI